LQLIVGIMGGLFSCCCGEEEEAGGDAGERTRLISDGPGHGGTLVPDGLHCEGRDGLGGLAQVYSRSVPKEGRDELSALNLILQDTATEIIDIASIEHTQGVEQGDYNEKAAHYAKRLGQVGAQLVARHTTPPSLMLEAPSADQLERMMSLEPIAQADLALIREVAERVDEAVASFEVEHTEELVVPFGDN